MASDLGSAAGHQRAAWLEISLPLDAAYQNGGNSGCFRELRVSLLGAAKLQHPSQHKGGLALAKRALLTLGLPAV